MSLTEIVNKLHNFNLLTDANYQEVIVLINNDKIVNCSALLTQLYENQLKSLLGIHYGAPVNFAIPEITDEIRS